MKADAEGALRQALSEVSDALIPGAIDELCGAWAIEFTALSPLYIRIAVRRRLLNAEGAGHLAPGGRKIIRDQLKRILAFDEPDPLQRLTHEPSTGGRRRGRPRMLMLP